MEKADDLLQEIGCTIYEVRIPDGKAVGWDLADAVAEGMTAEEIISLINAARLVNPTPLDLFGDLSLVGAPELPEGCLPPAIELFARDQAKLIGIDPGVMGLACIVTAAGAIHDHYMVQPKRNDPGWRESARIWGAFIDNIGTKKSPTIKAAIAPLRDAEIAKYDASQTARERYKIAEKIYAKALETYAAKRAKNEPCAEPLKPARPLIWRRVVNDVTLEKLSDILVDNPGGVACMVNELSTWFTAFDAYRAKGAGRDRGLWLELHDGGVRNAMSLNSSDEQAEVRRQRCLTLRAPSRALPYTAEPGPDRPAHYSRQGFRLTLTADGHSYGDTRTSLCETRGLHIRGGERSDSTPYSQPRAQGGRERSRGDGPYGCGLSTFPRSVGKRLGTRKPAIAKPRTPHF